MTPHYDANGITLYVGDAREVLPTLPSGRDGFDLLVMDPPYGVRAKGTGMRSRKWAREVIANDETVDVATEIVALAWRSLRFSRHAYVFGPFDLNTLAGACGVCELIWDKVLPTAGALLEPWGKQHERISFARRADGPVGAGTRGGQLARMRAGTVLRYQRHHAGGAKYHIADKPVPLLRELIEMSSRPGDTVLDPTAGSGATLVAALVEGRKAVGVELEVQWADIAAERLRALTDRGNPFAFEATE